MTAQCCVEELISFPWTIHQAEVYSDMLTQSLCSNVCLTFSVLATGELHLTDETAIRRFLECWKTLLSGKGKDKIWVEGGGQLCDSSLSMYFRFWHAAEKILKEKQSEIHLKAWRQQCRNFLVPSFIRAPASPVIYCSPDTHDSTSVETWEIACLFWQGQYGVHQCGMHFQQGCKSHLHICQCIWCFLRDAMEWCNL